MPGPLDLEKVFGVIESVKEQLTREIERGLRQHDIAKATWALAGKEACDRVRTAISCQGAQQDYAEQREAEMIQRQQARAARRAAQKAARDAEQASLDLEIPTPDPLPESAPEIHTEIQKLHQSRTRLLRAIDARQFQQRRKSG
jgi:hypothetical protein